MNKQTFLDYIDTYNTDKAKLGRFYSPALVFENFALTLSGSDLGAFFQSLHGVLEDRIDPVMTLVDDQGAALFGRHRFRALKDADLPLGAMKAGDEKTLTLFAFYECDGDLITRIRLTYWPEGR